MSEKPLGERNYEQFAERYRLCALVPPPRAHTVLAHHKLRSAVVPRADEPEPAPKQLSLFTPRGQLELPAINTLLHAQLCDAAPSRLPWTTLLDRVFRVDISACSRCCGTMRVTRADTTPQEIAAELRGARPPPRPAPVGQLLLFSAPPAAPESRSTSASLLTALVSACLRVHSVRLRSSGVARFPLKSLCSP